MFSEIAHQSARYYTFFTIAVIKVETVDYCSDWTEHNSLTVFYSKGSTEFDPEYISSVSVNK